MAELEPDRQRRLQAYRLWRLAQAVEAMRQARFVLEADIEEIRRKSSCINRG